MTLPAVTAVVACRNEARHVDGALTSLLAQREPPGGFELLVVDGMSDDGTWERLQGWAKRDSRVRLLRNPHRFKPAALNLAIAQARGRYIAILDAHHRYAEDYLLRCVEVLEETGCDNVGGAMFTEAETRMGRAIAAAHHSAFAVGGARWHNPDYEGPADTVYGGCFRREVFDRVGLFDEELVRNQDDEMNFRITRAGGRIWQSPRIRSWYRPRESLKALFRQYEQYGYWKVRVLQKHGRPASLRHLVPGTFVATVGGLAAAGLLVPPLWLPLGGVLVAYSAALGVASWDTARKSGWDLLPLLPAVFACYHWAYGWGFLQGLWDFVLLRRPARPRFTAITRASR